MNEFMAARKRLLAKELRELADDIADESNGLRVVRDAALKTAALIADQVEAKAEPGHGKETAAEIGKRIRALIKGGR